LKQDPRLATNPESPCIRVCSIDPDTELCRGCLRSLGEIAAWSRLGSAERRAIMAALPGRAATGKR
jgi:predicted Fe-S protein YdhL (DUF1289 family)